MKKILMLLLLCASPFIHTQKKQPWSGPDFLIIGAAKCGTTALFNYLIKHPQIKAPTPTEEIWRKELYFFDRNFFDKDINWYQKQFPEKKDTDNFLIFEATPHYFTEIPVAKRVFKFFPKTKFIILLRNPTERAFSLYKMHLRTNHTNQPFETLIKREIPLLRRYQSNLYKNIIDTLEYEEFEVEKIKTDKYLLDSLYILHLKRWLQYFPKEQFLILLTDDLLKNPKDTVNKVLRFLDLSELTLPSYPKYHVAKNNNIKMKTETRRALTTLFRPFNQALQDLLTNELGLDIQLNWD